MKIPLPPIITVSSILLAYIFAWLIPVAVIIPLQYRYWGFIVIVAGLTLAGWAISALIREKTTTDPRSAPSVLITTGPFAISRNPIYLGNILVVLGASIYLGSLSAFVAPILTFSLLNALIIPFEEEKLAELFSIEYQAYKAKVRRWL